MARTRKLLTYSLFLSLFATSACDGNIDYAQYRTDLKTGDIVFLYQMPDSAYISEIDQRLANEPLTEEARRKRADVAISITPGKVFQYPNESSKSAVEAKTKESFSDIQELSTFAPQTKSSDPHFTERFISSLEKLLNNPTEKGLSLQVTSEPGETFQQLLVRKYGTDARSLPLNLVSYQLKLINPGVDFNQLQPGEELLLPKL